MLLDIEKVAKSLKAEDEWSSETSWVHMENWVESPGGDVFVRNYRDLYATFEICLDTNKQYIFEFIYKGALNV